MPTWLEISKSAFDHNISQIKSVIDNRAVAIVIKANAYGHGMKEIASLAEQNNLVDWLCVVSSSEALTLRNAGITKPIIVLGFIDNDPMKLVGSNIHLMIDTYELAQELNKVGKTYNYIFPVHIKVDTGLSRFGIKPHETIGIIKKIQSLSHVTIQGIYSHFTESPKLDRSFTNKQISQFQTVLQTIRGQNIYIPLIHMANSAATTTIDLPFCNLFRIGINTYGLWPSPETKKLTSKIHPKYSLKPILTWKARIISLKTFGPNSFVGYDRTFKTTRTTHIATIPVGYYDGYNIRLSNNSSVLLHKLYAPVIGRIAMNATLIDATDIPNTKIGDELILMGNYPHLHPYDLGKRIQNFNVREITATINSNIPRIISP